MSLPRRIGGCLASAPRVGAGGGLSAKEALGQRFLPPDVQRDAGAAPA